MYFRSTDLACNVSTDDINLIKDNTPPTVAITRTITAPTCGDGYITNQSTVEFTATFSEDVMNFDVADVQLDLTGTASGTLGVTQLNPALYTITVSSVVGDGTLGVTILAGPDFTDLASNEMVADETSNTFLIDNTLPTLTINLNPVTNGDDGLKITNDDNVSFELVFDEIVDNLTIADVDVNVTGTVTHDAPILTGPVGLVYTVAFTNVAGDGTLGITVNNADFSDLACNILAADVVSGVFTIDNTSPEPVISTTSIDPTNDYPVELTIDFGEEVTGFVVGDITVTGTGTLDNFATVDGIVYTVEYSPDPQASEQDLSFVVLASVSQDLASNDNLVSNILEVIYDGRSPIIAITNPTNGDELNSTLNDLEFTVDETLEDGTVEITWNNGTDWYALAGEFNVADSPFNILLSTLPNHSEGFKQFMLRGEDEAGNVGTSNMVEFTIDNTTPMLTITAPAAGSFNMGSATFSYTTDENITGVEISYNGGTTWFSLPNQTAGTYTTTISALPSVPANADVDVIVRGYDAAMNLGTSAEVSFTIDNTPPVITYASPASQNEYFNAGNKNLTLNVNEDLQMAQISWSPNVWDDLGPLTAGAGAYDELFEDVPGYPGEGEHTIVVRGYDLAGNESGPVVRLINIDNTPPVLEITAPLAGDYVQSSASIHFTTNEFLPISTLYVSWNANDATPDWYPVAGSFTAGTHTFVIHPISGWTEGMVDVAVKGSDRAGNEGISATVSFTIDNTPPTPVITAVTAVTPTNHYPIEMQVDFGEVVTGFTMSDLTIANGYAGNFVDVDGQVYTFDLYANVEESEVTLTVNIAGGVSADLAGNLNNPALQFSINYDGVRPTANITTTFTDPTNQAPIPVTITFSESVATLIGAHFTATNAILLNLTEITPGLVWTAELTPNLGFNDGVITLELEENMVADAAGNLNEPAYFDIYYDVVKPDVTIATVLTSPTNNPAIPLTITFTEDVTGLAVGDFTVTNGYLTNFAGSDDTYTADLVPNNVNGHNTLSVLLPANSAFDAATNGNNVSNTLSIVYDGIDPELTITNPADGDHVKSSVSFTFTKSESITNAQIKWNTGSWIAFPAANGAAVSSNAISSLPGYPGEGSFMITVYGEDAAGNSGEASISIVIDNTPPVITITQPVNNGEYQSTDKFNFTIDELLDVAELRWNGTVWVSFPGGVNTLSGSINIGDLPGYPGEGTHNVEFRGYDQAGNWSIATVTNFTVSDQPPVVSITGLIAGNTYNNTAMVTFNTDKYHIFEFSFDGSSWEDITGVLTGGSLGYYATKSLGSLVDDLTSWNALPDGNVTLYIQSTDIFNQTTGTSLNIVKDDTAPQWDPVDPIVEIVSFDKADMTAAIDEDGSAHYILTSVPMGSLPTPAYVKANKTGTMVLPQGTPITVNFTGLTELTDYYVYIVAEDEFGNIQAVTTLIEFTTPEQFIPEAHSNLYVAGRTLSTITLKWTKHPDSDVFIVAKQGSLVNFDESQLSGNTFSANNDLGLGHHFGMGNYVVYDGTGNQVVIRSLAANTVYHFSLYAKAEDENGIVQYNILATDVLKISQRTLRKEGIEADGDVASINGDLIVSGLRPNPASTDITFELEVFENTQIQVEVINAAGQVVANLMNNQMYNDGIHSLRFPLDENNISSGAYFLKVTANGNEFVVVPFNVVK